MAVVRVLGCVAVMGAWHVAVADDARLSGLHWDAPVGCPDAVEVRHRIERRLADDVGVVGIDVTVVRERRTGTFIARIETDANRPRTLRGRRCADLADAVAVIVARLATEAKLRARPAPSPGPIEMPAMTVAEKRLENEPTPLVSTAIALDNDAQPGRWGGGVRALAVSGIGVVPGVGLAGELGAFVRRNDAFVELGYARWAESTTFLVAGAPGHVDVGLQMAVLRGGWSPRRMPLRAWFGAEAGVMHGAGVALVAPARGSARWTAASSGFGVAWPMWPHARLVGTFEVAANLERPSFTLAAGGAIYEPSRLSARCAVGFEVGVR